jgi:excisionase family DNA binding protein
MTATTRLTLTAREVADLSGFSLAVVQAAVARGDLKAIKPSPESRYSRIRRQDVDAWLAGMCEA